MSGISGRVKSGASWGRPEPCRFSVGVVVQDAGRERMGDYGRFMAGSACKIMFAVDTSLHSLPAIAEHGTVNVYCASLGSPWSTPSFCQSKLASRPYL